MPLPKREPRVTPYTDRHGRGFVLGHGERFLPVRASYGLNSFAVFDAVSRGLIHNETVRAMLTEVFRAGVEGRAMRRDEALALMVEGVAHVRTELSRRDVEAVVYEAVPRILAATEEDRLRTKGKTARELTRAVRQDQVKSLKRYRR